MAGSRTRPNFHYRMETPCADCPFSSSKAGRHLARSLRPGRLAEIKRGLLRGQDFKCHKTTGETGDGSNLLCAGAIAWQDAHGASGQMARIGERLAWMARQRAGAGSEGTAP